MKNVGIMTSGFETVPLAIINSQRKYGYKVTALVYSPYNKDEYFRPLGIDLLNRIKQLGIPVDSIHRPYSWKRTSMEVFEKQPRLVRKYLEEVRNVFDSAKVDLVAMYAQDHVVDDNFLMVGTTLNVHPSDPEKHGGIGMDHYTVLEEVLKAKEPSTQVTIMKLFPKLAVDEGFAIDKKEVSIPLKVHQLFDQDTYKGVMKLDELIESTASRIYPPAIGKY